MSKSFYREFYSVFVGRKTYYDDLKSNNGNDFLLRRNTHRLEKGLLMRPLREIFAVDYIQETVNNYIDLKKGVLKKNDKNATFQWSTDVLNKYFEIVGDHPVISKARDDYYKNRLYKQDSDEGSKKIPYNRINRQVLSYEKFYELSKQRRSIRWFLKKKVPKDLIVKAVEAAKFSPSACNRQPFSFRVFDNEVLAQKIGSIPGGTKGFSQNFPALMVVVGDLSAYPFERDRHIIYIDGALASMSFMFALETLGLSSCPINWPDVEHLENKMDNVLNLKAYERPIMLIAFGYPDPDGLVAFSEKKSIEEIAIFNKVNLDYV